MTAQATGELKIKKIHVYILYASVTGILNGHNSYGGTQKKNAGHKDLMCKEFALQHQYREVPAVSVKPPPPPPSLTEANDERGTNPKKLCLYKPTKMCHTT